MHGRFSRFYTWQEVWEFSQPLGLHLPEVPRNLRPQNSTAPTTSVDVLQAGDLVTMRRGLVPSWWQKPLRELPATFNAPIETVPEKPMFRSTFRSRRCIVPASGYFEWTDKVPRFFSAADGSPILALAGLWEAWRNPESGEDVLSATIIVGAANLWAARFHDRMPVMLSKADAAAWVAGEVGAAGLRPAPEDALREWTVSTGMNRSGAEDDDRRQLRPCRYLPVDLTMLPDVMPITGRSARNILRYCRPSRLRNYLSIGMVRYDT